MVPGIEPNGGSLLYWIDDIQKAIENKFGAKPATIIFNGNKDLLYEVRMCVDYNATSVITCPNQREYRSNCQLLVENAAQS